MSREYIRDEHGNSVRDGEGHRLFWSDSDGDHRDDQKVYAETSQLSGSEELDGVRYNPETGEFKS